MRERMSGTTRRMAEPATTDIKVATQLAVMHEILARLEKKLDEIDDKVDGHAIQIDRWRTGGKVLAPLLVSLGAGFGWLADRVLSWLLHGLGR
jgi:hypothetical protein